MEPDGRSIKMTRGVDGYWEAVVQKAAPGSLYRYRLDGKIIAPDPASRFQPEGVHGPSMVVDPAAHSWSDGDWAGVELEDLVFYELHVGAFTREGTFASARDRLGYLRELGVTALELMPVSEFPGRWNWGYDPASLFAPSHTYGAPQDLQAFVDEAHRRGLAVFLDVIYNHFGPDGAYASVFDPTIVSRRHRTPWGPAINFDGEGSAAVRRFFIENALRWLEEYHVDGLRLDATHSIVDESEEPLLRELARAVHALPGRRRYVIAEDHRNLKRLILPEDAGGDGLDAVWSDDYHHQLRRVLTGDRDGYFIDFTTSTSELSAAIRDGWIFAGRYSRFFDEVRGTDPGGLPLSRFVHFLQNHDQVGNRPTGARITDRTSLGAFRAATALLLFAPALPLLFMGQEWAATTPFRFFTDHQGELGPRVSEGRRREFARFEGFQGELPDPQDPETFWVSHLDWADADHMPHAGVLRLHRDLLRLRRRLTVAAAFTVDSPVEGGLVLRRGQYVLLAALRDSVELEMPRRTEPVLHTEEAIYADQLVPPQVSLTKVFFPQPAAVVLEVAG